MVFVSQGIISGGDRDFLAQRINETLDEQYSRNLSLYASAGLYEKAVLVHAIGRAPMRYGVSMLQWCVFILSLSKDSTE